MAEKKKIKERIQATEKTYQITSAMNMVSTAKLRRVEKKLKSFKPISDSIRDTMNSLLLNNPDLSSKAFIENEKKPCYILIASDRGLIGNYNNALFRYFDEFVSKHFKSKDDFLVATMGFKAFSFAKKKGYNILNKESQNIRDDVIFVDFEEVANSIVEGYLNGSVGKTVMIYNSFVNTMSFKIKVTQILPIKINLERAKKDNTEYIFEPSKQEVLDKLIKLDVSYTMYRIILEAKTSEHAARMNSMKNASDNAKEVEEKLTLLYNHARQNQITTELTDIINGSSAVN